jgi:hypothetical protein
MLGKEQLHPLPHMEAAGIGVNYEALDKTKFITLTEAGQLYTPLSGKLSKSRCRKMVAVDQNIAVAGRWVNFVPLYVTVEMGKIHFVEIVHHQCKPI